MKTLVTFCQKTGRRLRLYINRQVVKLSHKGQLKISVSLPLIAKVEVSYQCEFNAKADNDNKAK
ncbi:hypothetical protein ILFOPFJJ_06104 [Ensifer psoraleae]|uniref:hypothetical protein n=1 Tax=Sinorhizobium psoraleae TaxID=520838 RepID=UPI001568D247|nr:hypothetical protein [Sinorhizobium psoraleae]NRP75181.1 hypothetical protein [Sinorhizobium psoraleae]